MTSVSIFKLTLMDCPYSKVPSISFGPYLEVFAILKTEPFLIGLFFGLKKPDNVSDFLQRFLDEYLELRDNG